MAKKIIFDREAREALLKGVNEVANAVKAETLFFLKNTVHPKL